MPKNKPDCMHVYHAVQGDGQRWGYKCEKCGLKAFYDDKAKMLKPVQKNAQKRRIT